MKTLKFILLLLIIPIFLFGQKEKQTTAKIVINHEMIKRFNECITFDTTKTFSYVISKIDNSMTFDDIKSMFMLKPEDNTYQKPNQIKNIKKSK